MRQKLLLNTCLCRYSRLSVSQKYCLQLCLCNPAGILPAPLCVRHFSSLPRLVPTWTLCLYLICRIGESHTGGLNCLPTNYASAQNVIGPRGTVRRHPHSFGFLCANEARRKKALRCAALHVDARQRVSWAFGESAEGPWERRGGLQRRTARIYRGNISLLLLQQEGPSRSPFLSLHFYI